DRACDGRPAPRGRDRIVRRGERLFRARLAAGVLGCALSAAGGGEGEVRPRGAVRGAPRGGQRALERGRVHADRVIGEGADHASTSSLPSLRSKPCATSESVAQRSACSYSIPTFAAAWRITTA